MTQRWVETEIATMKHEMHEYMYNSKILTGTWLPPTSKRALWMVMVDHLRNEVP